MFVPGVSSGSAPVSRCALTSKDMRPEQSLPGAALEPPEACRLVRRTGPIMQKVPPWNGTLPCL